MINYELDRVNGILSVSPAGKLEEADFLEIGKEVDPYIEEQGGLSGLMIYTQEFPGWQDFSSLITHLKFIKDHHRKIAKVAVVADSKFMTVIPSIANHFISAEVKHFDYKDRLLALDWLKS